MSRKGEISPPYEADDFMSTADAKLLFVSRPHVVKLLERRKLKLHHNTGNNRFVMKASVLDYQADQLGHGSTSLRIAE